MVGHEASKGLVTSRLPEHLGITKDTTLYGTNVALNEASEILNLTPERGVTGGWVSRPGLELVLSGLSFDPRVFIETQGVIIASDGHYIYSVNPVTGEETVLAGVDVLPYFLPVGVLQGERTALLVLDGLPHLYDSQDTTRPYKLCYDISGYMIDNWTGNTPSAATSLRTGSTTRCGIKQTTPDWHYDQETVDEIPFLNVVVALKKTGAPTGLVYCKIYASDGTTLVATSTTEYDCALLSTSTYANIEFEFDGTVLTDPNVVYYFSVEYSGGSPGNTVDVGYSTVASGGTHVSYTGSWSAITATYNVAMAVGPGVPPDGNFAVEWASRVWMGVKNKSYVYYSNVYNILDWSAAASSDTQVLPDAGQLIIGTGTGYLNSIVPVQDSLFFVVGGTIDKVFKLEGTTPSDFSVKNVLDGVGGLAPWAAANVKGDGVVLDRKGLVSLTTLDNSKQVDESILSWQVWDRIRDFACPAATVSYSRHDSQIYIQLTGHSRVLVYDIPASKWCEYRLMPGVPNWFDHTPNGTLVSFPDGSIYKFNEELWEDNGVAFELIFQTSYFTPSDWDRIRWHTLVIDFSVAMGGTATLSFYKDGDYMSSLDAVITASIYGGTTLGEIADYTLAEVEDYDLSGTPSVLLGVDSFAAHAAPIYLTSKQLMLRLHNVTVEGVFKFKAMKLAGELMGRRME